MAVIFKQLSLFDLTINYFLSSSLSLSLCFRTYTQYSVVVQAFNKIGAGPTSDEVTQYTAEGTPEQPPQEVQCTTLTSQTIRVSWVAPALNTVNGVVKGYKVLYGPTN